MSNSVSLGREILVMIDMIEVLADIRCVVEKSSEKSSEKLNRLVTHARLRSTLR